MLLPGTVMGNRLNAMSRRSFVVKSAAFGMAAMRARRGLAARSKRTVAYVGTNTVPVDGATNGKAIYAAEVDGYSGELMSLKVAAETPNPSWLALHPSGRYLNCERAEDLRRQ